MKTGILPGAAYNREDPVKIACGICIRLTRVAKHGYSVTGGPRYIATASSGDYQLIDQPIARSLQPETEQGDKNAISALGSREMGGHRHRDASGEALRALTPLRYPIIGTSGATRAALRDAARVAPMEVPVLLLGETGTGKELFARAIHEWSRRAARPIVRVDCASLTRSFCESDLSGYAPSASDGAIQRHPSLIELASGGTLLLDEIGELPFELQPKLLHFIQERDCEPIKAARPLQANVRIIAATNRVLADDVATGRFRADLFYRLAGFVIQLPALRDRRDDVAPLIRYFMAMQAKTLKRKLPPLSAEVLAYLASCNWPGNVRELLRAVERACIVARDGQFRIDDFALATRHPAASETVHRERAHVASDSPLMTLRELERQHIASALRHCGGVIEGRRGAAAVLGLPPSTLRFRIRKHGMDVPIK